MNGNECRIFRVFGCILDHGIHRSRLLIQRPRMLSYYVVLLACLLVIMHGIC